MMFKSDTYMQRRAPEISASPKILLVPLTSDKGLCGGTNSGIVRTLRQFVHAHDRTKLSLFAIGDKGIGGLNRNMPDLMRVAISDVSKPINYPSVMAISEHIVNHAEGKDKIIVFYNEFKSAISTIIRQMELMPRSVFLDTLRYGKLYN
jgi:ATP synthase F1 gamma subunit